MREYPWRVQIAYGMVLSVLLIWGFLPLSLGWKILATLGAGAIASAFLWRLYERRNRLSRPTEKTVVLESKLDALPGQQRYRLPILLVCGNGTASFFSGSIRTETAIMMSAEAIWIDVGEPAYLPMMYDTLVTRWPDMRGRIGLFLTVYPEQEDNAGLFKAKLNAFRQSWADACRIARYALPVYVSTYVGLNSVHYDDSTALPVQWYQIIKKELYLLDTHATPIKNWVRDRDVDANTRQHRLHLQSLLHEIRDWIDQVILTTLRDPRQPLTPCVPLGNAIFPIHQHVVPNNVLNAHFMDKTTLPLPNNTPLSAAISPPDTLVKRMPMASPFSPLQTLCFSLIIVTNVFLVSGLLSSYWNNTLLVSVIKEHLHQYDLIAPTNYQEKAEALMALKNDRRLLNDYFQRGEPLKLSFGLYRGQRMLEPLNQAIGRYIQPPSEKKIIKEKEIVLALPEIIRLDSVSLFASGEATLKPEATKLLIESLLDIKTKIEARKPAGWVLLIAGHTDATGDPIKNQQLSLARAMAVKTWMSRNSDIPETCFATQGYGAKKPLVNNDTPEERAKNRRVEISLIPQASSCQ